MSTTCGVRSSHGTEEESRVVDQSHRRVLRLPRRTRSSGVASKARQRARARQDQDGGRTPRVRLRGIRVRPGHTRPRRGHEDHHGLHRGRVRHDVLELHRGRGPLPQGREAPQRARGTPDVPGLARERPARRRTREGRGQEGRRRGRQAARGRAEGLQPGLRGRRHLEGLRCGSREVARGDRRDGKDPRARVHGAGAPVAPVGARRLPGRHPRGQRRPRDARREGALGGYRSRPHAGDRPGRRQAEAESAHVRRLRRRRSGGRQRNVHAGGLRHRRVRRE